MTQTQKTTPADAADAAPENLTKILAELDAIAAWFETQDGVDVEAGLERVRRGAALIKQSKARLREVENIFEEIKNDLDQE